MKNLQATKGVRLAAAKALHVIAAWVDAENSDEEDLDILDELVSEEAIQRCEGKTWTLSVITSQSTQ